MSEKPTYEELEKRVKELEKNSIKYKSVEDALWESERLLSDVFNSIQDGISVLNTDLTISRVNDVMKKWYGKNLPLEGKKCHVCYHNSDQPCYPCPTIRCIKTGQTEREIVPGLPGSAVEWIELFSYPIIDQGSGEVTGVVEFVRDITERKKAEDALREGDEEYRLLVNNLPGIVYKGFKDWSVEFYDNRVEGLTGYNMHQFNSGRKKWIDLIVKEDIESAKQTFINALKTDKSYVRDYRLAIRDGNIIWIQERGHIVCNQDGDIEYVSGVFYNISDRKKVEEDKKKLEEQLLQARKMESIGTLAGGIAHDFNNILSSVIGYTELALYEAKRGTLQHENLGEVLKAGDRAKDLVKQILTFSREVSQEQKPIQVKPIVKEALKLLRSSIPTTIEIKEDVQSNSLVIGDSTQIHQILMNLCTNAAHAMEDDAGLLTISLSDEVLVSNGPDLKPGPYINVTVTDTGHGISPDVMEKIFDPFFTTKEKGQGTGMGLSVVHGIVRSHGGNIYVYSEPGKGSTFKVYLPAIGRSLKPKEMIEKPIPTGTERILFIDDEPAIMKMGKQTLESLGYDVTSRASSIEALELFKKKKDRFDLVITDMTMPHMTGEKLAEELMQLRLDIPVILCTGFSSRIDEQKALAIGIRAFISKPFIKRELAEAIRKVLDEK
jgi:PAS domain S-box-containing protein